MKDSSMTTVGEIMTKPVITVHRDDSMDKVQDIFAKHNIHHIPVIEEGNRVVGIISKSDYLRILHGFTLFKTEKSVEYNNAIMRSLLVSEVMTRQVATLAPEDSLEMAAGFFRENLFHALPVIENGVLIGIITTFDLITYAYADPYMLSLKD